MKNLLTTAIILALLLMPSFANAQEEAEKTAVPKLEIRYLTSYPSNIIAGNSPFKLHIDKTRSELYVATSGGKSIAVINNDGLRVFRIILSKKKPVGFCVNSNGIIYIAYRDGDVKLLNYRGEHKGQLDLSSVPEPDSIEIQSLHCGSQGNIYLGESRLSRVIVMDGTGKFLYQFGERGAGKGEFLNAFDLATDDERIYVLDPALFRVLVFKKGGEFLFQFGKVSAMFGGFAIPSGIDSDGERVFVTDSNRTVVIVFNLKGKPINEFGWSGSRKGGLSWPSDVKVDGNGKIFVADKGNNRVQVYKIVPSADSTGKK